MCCPRIKMNTKLDNFRAQGCFNPKRIVSYSPGLRGTSYPGFGSQRIPTPTGLHQLLQRTAATPMGLSGKATISQGGSGCSLKRFLNLAGRRGVASPERRLAAGVGHSHINDRRVVQAGHRPALRPPPRPRAFTQEQGQAAPGRSFVATLGWRMESLWGSIRNHPKCLGIFTSPVRETLIFEL